MPAEAGLVDGVLNGLDYQAQVVQAQAVKGTAALTLGDVGVLSLTGKAQGVSLTQKRITACVVHPGVDG